MGVNSIGEEINVRKVIPPSFIMILWKKKRLVNTSRSLGRKGGSKGQECLLVSLRGEGFASNLMSGDWCSWEMEPHVSKRMLGRSEQAEELLYKPKVFSGHLEPNSLIIIL